MPVKAKKPGTEWTVLENIINDSNKLLTPAAGIGEFFQVPKRIAWLLGLPSKSCTKATGKFLMQMQTVLNVKEQDRMARAEQLLKDRQTLYSLRDRETASQRDRETARRRRGTDRVPTVYRQCTDSVPTVYRQCTDTVPTP